jgi:hypothetical protein
MRVRFYFLLQSNCKMLGYVINSVIIKIFNTKSNDVTSYCLEAFGIDPLKDTVQRRREVFLHRLAALDIHLPVIL